MSLDPLRAAWTDPKGIAGWFQTVQNGPVSARYITTAFGFFLVAGVMALLMRTQLIRPENDLLDAQLYNQLFTVHGSTMMFLFAVPVMEAFANALLPHMIGARELPFPRMTAFGYWTYLFGGLLFFFSFLYGAVPDGGWFAYVPLTGATYSPGLAIDFWLLGLSVAEVAAIGAAAELAIAVLKCRAPGMSLDRMPIFAWSVLVMAAMIVFAFTPLIVGTTLLELDRKFGFTFFDPESGGDPLLWQHLFWIFGHPDVYIQFIPAAGMVSMIVPTFARRPLVGHTAIVAATIGTGVISFGLWVHHMFTTGQPVLGMSFFAAASFAISIASGVQVFAWIATLWSGRPVFATPLLWVLGFLAIFVLGGITGVMVAFVPFDWQVHDTFFVVAHFHYVLIGGVVFPAFGALYYWLPLLSGRLLSERLGKWNFWLTFVGFHVAFFPMHVSGLLGMPRRVYTYPAGVGLEPWNLLSTLGAYVLALGIGLFLWNVVWSFWLGRGREAGLDPWRAGTLEWAEPLPPPDEGFRYVPIVTSRYPLWEQASLREGEPRLVRLQNELAIRPTSWRAGLMTSVLEARPQAVIRFAGPSWLPLIVGAGLTLLFSGTLFDDVRQIAAGAVGTLGGLSLWLWPRRRDREEEDELGDVAGTPVGGGGGRLFGYWATWVVVAVLAVAVASLLFCYFHLRGAAPAWPPAGFDAPPLWGALASGALLLLSSGAMRLALRGVRRGQRLQLIVTFAFGWLLGASALALQLLDLAQTGYRPGSHAYASAFVTLAGFEALLLLAALLLGAAVQVQVWLGHFSARAHGPVENVVLYWHFVVASWPVVAGVLYLVPRLG